MQLAKINKRLSGLEKNLDSIQAFQQKGCPVESSMGDIYLDLRGIEEYLKGVRAEDNKTLDQELAETTERYKNVLAKFESIADEGGSQDQGMVMASSSTLPDFFCRITERYRNACKTFEQIATMFGVGMIGFTVMGPAYFLSVGKFPFIQFSDGVVSAINGLVFVVGIIVGLCVHEFAHGIVLANNGIKIKRVGAMAGSMVGGFVEADETSFFQADPKVHLRFNAASIGTNALLAVVLIVIALVTSSQEVLFLALGNLFFGFINSYPISPLDGGWVYEDLIKLYINSERARDVFLALPFVVFVLWIVLFIRYALL